MVDSIHSVGTDRGPATGQAGKLSITPQHNPVSRAGPGKGAQAEASVSAGNISDVVTTLNEFVNQVGGTKIAFDVDEATGHSVVKVLNKETGELIRQVPPEQLLALMAKMEQLSGLIFNREV